MLTLKTMQRRWPNANQQTPGLLEALAEASTAVFARYGLNSPLLVSHAMAQFTVESAAGTVMLENLNYTAQRLLIAFPRHFTPATAAQAARNPQLVAEIVYAGHLGNAPAPSPDGFNFRAAGLSRVTGRTAVAHLHAFLNRHGADFDILANPALLLDPSHALECGVAHFVLHGCLPHAQANDLAGVTTAFKGTLQGLAERRHQLTLWKAELGGEIPRTIRGPYAISRNSRGAQNAATSAAGCPTSRF